MAVRNKPMERIPCDVIDRIWKGSIDMHIHPGPDAQTNLFSGQICHKCGMWIRRRE